MNRDAVPSISRDVSNAVCIYIVTDGFYTNAFIRSEEQIAKFKLLGENIELTKVPLDSIHRIVKEAGDSPILIYNIGCNMINGMHILEFMISEGLNIDNVVSVSNTIKHKYASKSVDKTYNDFTVKLWAYEELKDRYNEYTVDSELATIIFKNFIRIREKLGLINKGDYILQKRGEDYNKSIELVKDELIVELKKMGLGSEVCDKIRAERHLLGVKNVIESTDTKHKKELTFTFNKLVMSLNSASSKLDISVDLRDIVLYAFDNIRQEYEDVYKSYYSITIDQMLFSHDSTIEETFNALSENLGIKKEDILCDNEEDMPSRIEAYLKIFASWSHLSTVSLYNGIYKRKLYSAIEELNKHGIMVDEISKLLCISFLIPNDMNRKEAIDLIYNVFKENNLEDTIWRMHILRANEYRHAFMNYNDENTVYFKEVKV